MQIKTVKEHVDEAMQVFNSQAELRLFLGNKKFLHHNTFKKYIDTDFMPFSMRQKMINETKRRLKKLTN